MIQKTQPDDYIIATGQTFPLEVFVEHAFTRFRLGWWSHAVQDLALKLPTGYEFWRTIPRQILITVGLARVSLYYLNAAASKVAEALGQLQGGGAS